jgi:RNA polymerase sigma-70 factor (ECF subfamily)
MTSTSVTLLQRVRQREDREAWARLASLYTPLLLRWTRLAGLPEADAADLVQDVFVVLAAELPDFKYDPARGSFRGWLKTVTVNKCREQQRRRKQPVGQGGVDDPLGQIPDPAVDAFWEAEYRQYLCRKALQVMQSQFEPSTWQACWRQVVEGQTAADVARQLGLSEAAVYVAKFRVLRKLRHELAGLID